MSLRNRWAVRRRYKERERRLRELTIGAPSGGGLRRVAVRRGGLLAVLGVGLLTAGAVAVGLTSAGGSGSDDVGASADPAGASAPAGPDPVRVLPEVQATTTGAHSFMSTSGGRPVTYDPCRSIHYVVNPAGAPAEGDDIIREAVAEVSKATGLSFTFDGTTDARPSADPDAPVEAVDTQDVPVLIAWSTAAEHPTLAGDTAGYAGSQWREIDGIGRYTTGGVLLDREFAAGWPDAIDGRADVKAVVMHELAHLVGLDHVDDPGELMTGKPSDGVDKFGPGDLEGLAAVGAGPCSRPTV